MGTYHGSQKNTLNNQQRRYNMKTQDWKLAVGFIADILYNKRILNIGELEAINDLQEPEDMQTFIDNQLGGKYDGSNRLKATSND